MAFIIMRHKNLHDAQENATSKAKEHEDLILQNNNSTKQSKTDVLLFAGVLYNT